MGELLARLVGLLLLIALFIAAWTFTLYWTVRLIHAAWIAGPA